MLPIINYTDLFDFQKQGNFLNYKIGLPLAPINSMLTFFYYVENGGTITTFEARRVTIQDLEVTTAATVDLIAKKPTKVGTANYELSLQILASDLDEGIYYFYISDGATIKKSELFKVCSLLDIVFADFNEDFNNDFST